MDKKEIFEVLECCLLCSDGISEEKLEEKYGFEKYFAKAGYNLFLFLKSKKLGDSGEN